MATTSCSSTGASAFSAGQRKDLGRIPESIQSQLHEKLWLRDDASPMNVSGKVPSEFVHLTNEKRAGGVKSLALEATTSLSCLLRAGHGHRSAPDAGSGRATVRLTARIGAYPSARAESVARNEGVKGSGIPLSLNGSSDRYAERKKDS